MNKPTIFYICNDFERALGLEKLLPNFHIICIDFNEGIPVARKSGAKIFCLEEELKQTNPIFRNSHRLLKMPIVQKYIRSNTPTGEIPNVMFFKIASNIELLCQQLGYRILNTSTELNQKFELKLSQYHELSAVENVRFPKTLIIQLESAKYDELVSELGENFVIQYDRGHTGSSTVFVSEEEIFNKEKDLFPKRFAKFSELISGEAWTLNACITRDGILFGGLCYQITGIESCTTKKGGTVGNDWSQVKRLSQDTLKQIQELTLSFGQTMGKSGYKGLFGIDIIIDKSGKVYLIEINARQAASTGMHTKLLLKQNQIPLNLLHIAEFLYPESTSDYYDFIGLYCCREFNRANAIDLIAEQNEASLNSINASQIILRNTQTTDLVAQPSLKTAIYKLENNELVKTRDGYSIDEIYETNEFLLLITASDRTISPEAEIARIQATSSLLDQNLLPSRDTLRIIELVKADIEK